MISVPYSEDVYAGLELLPPRLEGWPGVGHPFFVSIITQERPLSVIEVGTWLGASAVAWARAMRAQGLPGRVVCVDTWLGSLEFVDGRLPRSIPRRHGRPVAYEQFLSNVVHEGLQEYILPFPTTSAIAARWFVQQDVQADMVYLDASHDYTDVIRDLSDYYPLVRPGGLLIVDDYTIGAFPGVRAACDASGWPREPHPETRWWITRVPEETT